MTKLKVRPIDASQPGSFRLQRTLIKASRRITSAKESGDGINTIAGLDDIYDLVVDRLYVDDDRTTVDDELNAISVEDFQQLIYHLTGEVVPTTSSEP